MGDFVIENMSLEKYTGLGGDVVIPDGVEDISCLAFENTTITSLSLPVSMWHVPRFIPQQNQLSNIYVAEGNAYFKSVDGVLYTADMTELLLCPGGHAGELCIPNGVKKVGFDALLCCHVTDLLIPGTLEVFPSVVTGELRSISVEEDNTKYKSADGVLYDSNMETLMCYPADKGSEFWVPESVKSVFLDSIANVKDKKYYIHVNADVSLKIKWTDLVEGNSHITIFAPIGSEAERMARRFDCAFEPEGDPVSVDDSDERKERSFQDWRQIFAFTAKKKGLHLSKYVRGLKVVYLPDKLGKSEIAEISKTAFMPDVTVLCSQKLFSKLSDENQKSTMRSYLANRDLFTDEEQAYLLNHLKKRREEYLGKYIKEEDYSALEACFAAMPRVKTLMEECLEITERCEKQQVNLFLLQMNQKTKGD